MSRWAYDDEYAYQITESPGGAYQKAVVHRNRTPIMVAERIYDEYTFDFKRYVSDPEDIEMRTKRILKE